MGISSYDTYTDTFAECDAFSFFILKSSVYDLDCTRKMNMLLCCCKALYTNSLNFVKCVLSELI